MRRLTTAPPILALLAALVPLVGTPDVLGAQTPWGIDSDANFRASSDDEVIPHFAIGGVEFFVVQRLGSRARVLSEDVLGSWTTGSSSTSSASTSSTT